MTAFNTAEKSPRYAELMAFTPDTSVAPYVLLLAFLATFTGLCAVMTPLFLLGGPMGLLTLRRLRVDLFGPDPAGRSFGARRFSVAGSHGHSDYFRSGSTSVRNITRITIGQPVNQP